MYPRDVEQALSEWGQRLFRLNVQRYAAQAGNGYDGSSQLVGGIVRTKLRFLLGRAPEVMVRVTGGGRGMTPIRAHMSYISRGGTLPLEDERGERTQGKEALADLVQEWRLARSCIPSRSHRREALNLMLSMPLGTDGHAVFAAAREFAQSALAGHKFAIVMHEPHTDERSNRPHVHLVVRMQGQDGTRLHPMKTDLAHWREQFADHLAEHGVAANATRRHTRGEFAPRFGKPDPRVQARENAVGFVSPSERASAAQAQVLAAWRGVVGALSRSDDLQDQNLAREALAFLLQMPMIAGRRAMSLEQEKATIKPAVEWSAAIKGDREVANALRQGQLERTR